MFKDLKVIELANVLAGPAVGMFFAELGAKVVKIENVLAGGDVTRQWKLPEESSETSLSAYFCSVNWGKESLFIDLTSNEGKQQVYAHVKDADIVISNYKSGDDLKLGMDYKHLKKINPGLIYGHISGFGPDDKRVAYDVVLQAEAGFMSMNGTLETGPLKMPVALIDLLAAHQLKEALLLAIINKMRTGNGAYVSISLFDAAIASLANQATNWLMAGHISKKNGSLHPNIAPYGETFTTQDGKEIVLAIGNDRQFKILCELLNKPQLATDVRFNKNSIRVKNRKALYAELHPIFLNFERDHLLNRLIANDIPSGAIRNMQEVFSLENAKKMIIEEIIEKTTTKSIKTIAFNVDFIKKK